MNILSYALAAIVAYLGIAAGLVIIRSAKEEQKAGKRYFLALQKTVLILIFISLFYFMDISLLLILSAAISAAAYHKNGSSYYMYPVFAVLFYMGSISKELLFILAVLLFIYGLAVSGILFTKKNYLEILVKHSSFLLISAAFIAAAVF